MFAIHIDSLNGDIRNAINAYYDVIMMVSHCSWGEIYGLFGSCGVD